MQVARGSDMAYDDSTIDDTNTHAEEDHPPISGLPITDALEQLRLRLLDLTGRNKLINFKHGIGKTIQFVETDFNAAFERLTGDPSRGLDLDFVPEPPLGEWEAKNGRLTRPDAKARLNRLERSTSYDLSSNTKTETIRVRQSSPSLCTLYYADELGKHGRKLAREARLAIEETGSNMLHLVFGFLEFPESPGSEKKYQAPLLCVPVSISVSDQGQYSKFTVGSSGEELTDNLSLREKIKRDFGLNLPVYLGEDEESSETYLRRVEEAVRDFPSWKVQRRITLTLLSFGNMLMVKDIAPETWADANGNSALLEHPLIRQVFEGSNVSSSEPSYANEYDIDNHPKGELPLIYDADSSQHSALIDVLEGKNRVIEGPPGTGKSQTITNIIAASLQAGKTVLFVAEKLAALEVVKSRLEQAGLEQFVLELHSNKTNKKRVLEDLKRRMDMRPPRLSELPERLLVLNEKKEELRTHMYAMRNTDSNKLKLTLHQVIWRAELNRLRCKDADSITADIEYPAALDITPAQHLSLIDKLKYAAHQYDIIGKFDETHPFWGLYPDGLAPQDTIPIQRILNSYIKRFDSFETGLGEAIRLLDSGEVTLDKESASKLINILAELAPADPAEVDFSLLPSLFSPNDRSGRDSIEVLTELAKAQLALSDMERERDKKLTGSFPISDSELASAHNIIHVASNFGLADQNCLYLESAHQRLVEAANYAVAGLRELDRVASHFGLPFEAQPTGVKKLEALSSILENIPLEFLNLRTPELLGWTTSALIKRYSAELSEIQNLRSSIENDLYLDALPDIAAVSEAVAVLREGNAWYRIFQGEWRKSIQLHKKLCRDKKKKQSSDDRLKSLERLREYIKRHEDWTNDSRLHHICGSAFDGERTPFEQLTSVSEWLTASTEKLSDLGVLSSILDPLTMTRADAMRHTEACTNVSKSIAGLNSASETYAQMLQNVSELVAKVNRGNWDERISEYANTVNFLADAVALLKSRALGENTLRMCVNAIDHAHKIPDRIHELATHEGGKKIFGTAYKGRDTTLSLAFAAHTYGTLLLRANLPEPLERLLLSAESSANYSAVQDAIAAIDAGWQALVAFESDLKQFGTVNIADWAGAESNELVEFVSGLAARTKLASSSISHLLPWAQYIKARDVCDQAGLSAFLNLCEKKLLPSSQLLHGFNYRFYSSIVEQTFRTDKKLRVFSGTRHSAVRKDFSSLDREVIKMRGAQVARDCLSSSAPPQGMSGTRVDEKTEVRLLEHLIPQQKPRVPLRKLLSRAGRAVQALKPCFMMGPQAVAQFLQPGHHHFDIVIMDEASQLKPEQALGAIARGSQLVVVGDPKQLPPTSFFSRNSAPEDDGDSGKSMAAVDAESILDVCISHFHPVRSLRWHYRSQHESLIAFSNQFFYRGNLVVFPSPFGKSKGLGLRYHYVKNGIYENQMNVIEARRVVDAVAAHITERPESSLGVVTLNVKQRDLISEMLEDRMKSILGADKFQEHWKEHGHELFVKNLENVQGDERDCIIISTTFGKPATAGVVRQNFGPISRGGGWRRLNVLFTRAKKSVVVYSSMRPEDIIVDKSTPEGTKALRNYLLFARDNVLSQNEETDLPPDSDFEVTVMDILRAKGYEVVPQLGVAGFRIDIAVRHPDHLSTYLAAIECDGATYHSGVSVRDRDRIRQEILEGLGWRGRIWRIWSTDWFRNPRQETERLLNFLQELRDVPVPDESEGIESEDTDYRTEDTLEPKLDSGGRARGTVIRATEADEMVVETGDLVTYTNLDSIDAPNRVRITTFKNDLDQGFIAETTPLAQALLGAEISDEVMLRVPGKPTQTLRILAIQRAGNLETQPSVEA
jgi:transcription elongation GreA/GreB family factor